ncbi:nuclear transport factor 2 family protein [Uliginosibacterium sp. H3]|uniref:Nuclear transport factor 2 family protein n=1 Tax=Uliginosibacterium silvisoli TaxID=3114758 RepID=A0ABU6K5H9_9RHOO|nr:nuclear transport factor 2 family protein [Uliginosibacterium sp. H3]
MNQHASSVDVALAFTKAWTSRDMATAAGLVAPDVVFEGPSSGAKRYLEKLDRLAGSITDLEMIGAYGKGDRALIIYDLHTGEEGTLTFVKCLTVQDGKIVRDELTSESFKIRDLQSA